MNFLHYDFNLSHGDVVEVTLPGLRIESKV